MQRETSTAERNPHSSTILDRTTLCKSDSFAKVTDHHCCTCVTSNQTYIASLEADLATAAALGTELVRQQQSSTRAFEAEKKTMLLELDALKDQLELLNGQNNVLLGSNSLLIEELEDTNAKLSASDEKIAALTGEIDTVHARLARINAICFKTESLEAQVGELELQRELLLTDARVAADSRREADIRWRKSQRLLEKLTEQYEHLELELTRARQAPGTPQTPVLQLASPLVAHSTAPGPAPAKYKRSALHVRTRSRETSMISSTIDEEDEDSHSVSSSPSSIEPEDLAGSSTPSRAAADTSFTAFSHGLMSPHTPSRGHNQQFDSVLMSPMADAGGYDRRPHKLSAARSLEDVFRGSVSLYAEPPVTSHHTATGHVAAPQKQTAKQTGAKPASGLRYGMDYQHTVSLMLGTDKNPLAAGRRHKKSASQTLRNAVSLEWDFSVRGRAPLAAELAAELALSPKSPCHIAVERQYQPPSPSLRRSTSHESIFSVANASAAATSPNSSSATVGFDPHHPIPFLSRFQNSDTLSTSIVSDSVTATATMSSRGSEQSRSRSLLSAAVANSAKKAEASESYWNKLFGR